MKQIDILGINVFDDSIANQFYINRLSRHLEQSHHHINRPHKHDSYAAILFTSGSGTHEIEFNSFQITPGSLFFLAPGQTHNWDLSDDAEGFVLFHSGDFFDAQFSNLRVEDFVFYSHRQTPERIMPGEDELAVIEDNFEKILREVSAITDKSALMILSSLTQIYILAERLSGNSPDQPVNSTYHLTFARFQDLLEKHFVEEKSPRRYADWLNVSSKHLNRINQTLFGKSTSELIIERIVLEAKRMLLHTSLNFTQIAEELGYSDYAYFSKLFRKHVGVSPSKFVNQYSGYPLM